MTDRKLRARLRRQARAMRWRVRNLRSAADELEAIATDLEAAADERGPVQEHAAEDETETDGG